MEIKIDYLEEAKDGIWSGWIVSHGDKYAEGLCYDEMLGLVVALTMPKERPTLNWLKTAEQHKISKGYVKNKSNEGQG